MSEQLHREPDREVPAATESDASYIATEGESASKDGGDDPYATAVLPVIAVPDPAEAGETVQEEEAVRAEGGLAEAMAAGARAMRATTSSTVRTAWTS